MFNENTEFNFPQIDAEDWLENIDFDQYRHRCKDFMDVILAAAKAFDCTDSVNMKEFAFLGVSENQSEGLWHFLLSDGRCTENEVFQVYRMFYESAFDFMTAIVNLIDAVECKISTMDHDKDETIKSLMDALIATGKEALEDGKGI